VKVTPSTTGPFSLAILLCVPSAALALDPHKLLTQYSRAVWNQEQGIPQDTVHRIAQTNDGYLWIGTAEGLARFDGYEFVSFDKDRAGLPANSITALTASTDGSLWIGTPSGLALYRDGHFRTFTTKDGLPDNAISALYQDRTGTLWIAAGLYLSRYESGSFTTYSPGKDIPITSVRALCGDRDGALWIAGLSGIAKWANGKFVRVIDAARLGGNIPVAILADSRNNVWIAGPQGLIVHSPAGQIRQYDSKDGLPDNSVRALMEDRDGNIWAGTNGGIARFENGRFTTLDSSEKQGRDLVFSLFEDRERNLWVGTNSGLNRFRDDIFTVYGTSEGLPSDVPNSVFQDSGGRIWVGFHNSGLMLFSHSGHRVYATRDGLPVNEVLSIRESRNGDLLLGTPAGLCRMTPAGFKTYHPPDPLGRLTVYDALEDSHGRLWLATPSGLGELREGKFQTVIFGGPLLSSSFGVISEGRDGSIWAGTLGKGLWRVKDGQSRLFTTADGLSSNGIRSLYEDAEGTLWIGTFGGGLNAFQNGKFQQFTTKDGLLSNNVGHVTDDGESLWLSTTRGICRVRKQNLRDFAAGKVAHLSATNYGVEDGLRSAQSGPSHPVAGGGTRTSDGRLWFPTSRGLAVLKSPVQKRPPAPPPIHIVEMQAEGRPVDLTRPAELSPGSGRIQIRYTAIYLSAPERVQYSYRLEGVDRDWVQGGNRRVIDYSGLRPGHYRFFARAKLPDGPASEQTYSFILLPHFYQTLWFVSLCAALLIAGVATIYRLRLGHVRNRFRLVLEERSRIAREIHDTLAQGFAGISSQLEAVAMCIPEESKTARQHLDLARKMARHSLTEARRSVMDLRASALEGQDLGAALHAGARVWAATSGVDVEVEIVPPPGKLPHDIEQNLLRIAQEAVANALKHAGASKICVRLSCDAGNLYLRISDNGRGFDSDKVFSTFDGHFGLVGMRERAERVRGEFKLESKPSQGTAVEVMVPLP
jgi:ligand-binding sensor domain-containing protein/two-component sensor histidine kinase